MLDPFNWYIYLPVISFIAGWMADALLGDPTRIPHPIVVFGKVISIGEKTLNQGQGRFWNGLALSMFLLFMTYFLSYMVLFIAKQFSPILFYLFIAIGVFYCLAGRTLRVEVKKVFDALENSVEDGRKQLARIVGRDTSSLSPNEIRAAALETLSENLSDGVIAPMFWFAVLGLPGMFVYKMINTMDSMIGYKNDRYKDFGKAAAIIDDIANYIPARITSFLMLAVSGRLNRLGFVKRFGKAHASPNAGYPEAALAAILNCQFGGTHLYAGVSVSKPYIGENKRELTYKDMKQAISVNQRVEVIAGLIVCIILFFYH